MPSTRPRSARLSLGAICGIRTQIRRPCCDALSRNPAVLADIRRQWSLRTGAKPRRWRIVRALRCPDADRRTSSVVANRESGPATRSAANLRSEMRVPSRGRGSIGSETSANLHLRLQDPTSLPLSRPHAPSPLPRSCRRHFRFRRVAALPLITSRLLTSSRSITSKVSSRRVTMTVRPVGVWARKSGCFTSRCRPLAMWMRKGRKG